MKKIFNDIFDSEDILGSLEGTGDTFFANSSAIFTGLANANFGAVDYTAQTSEAGKPLFMNSAPVTEPMPDLAGAVTEIADGVFGENTETLEATGDINFTDADIADVHSVGTAPVGGGVGFIGLFFAGLSDPATGDGAGTVTWTFQINDALLDNLNAGEVITQDYEITIDDEMGGLVTETVTITITGSADAAVVTGDTSGASTEDSGVTTTGDLDHTDVDNADVDDVWNTAVTVNGIYGTLTITAAGVWEYTLNDADPVVDALAVGEPLVDTITVETTDGTTQDITINITGANDAPTVGAAITGGSTEDDAPFSVDMLTGAADVDTSDVLSVANVMLMSGDSSGVTQNGNALDVDPNAYNYLSVGESAVIIISYDVIDGNGGSAAQTATITITGENDAPTVSGAVTGGSTEDDALFSVDMRAGASDVDLSDTLNVDGMSLTLVSGDDSGVTVNGNSLDVDPSAYNYLAVGESAVIVYSYDIIDGEGGSVAQTATITITGENDAPTVGAAVTGGSTEDDAGFSVDMLAGASDVDLTDILNVDAGSVMTVSGDDSGVTLNGNALDVDPNAYNYLAVGESAVIVIGYNIIDGNGGSVAQTATITITGENDTPTVAGAVTDGGTEDDALFSVDMLDGATDPDLSDVLNVDGMSVTLVSGDDSGVTVNGNALDVDPNAYNHLAVGESEVIVYSYDIIDGNGGLVAQTATITITGENDAPTVAAAVTGGSTEDDMAFSVDMLAGATDVDLTDTLNVDGMSVTLVSGDDSGVTVNGNALDVDPSAYNYLAVGESAVIVYSYDIIDGNGGTVAQTATITITGENDAPTVSGAVTDGSTEDDAPFSVDLLDGASDPDLSDILITANIMLTGGDDSGMVVSGDFINVDPDAYTYLAVGESEVITYSYDIIDGNGGSVPQTATITITGENDAPTVAAAVTDGSTEDDMAFSVDMLAGASDVDLTDTLNVDGMSVMLVSGDDSGVTVNGNDLDVDPNAYNYLAVGESAVIVYSYDIIDGNGGSVAQTATITITGENDAPTVAAAVTGGGNEDDALFSVDMLAGASDPDTSDVLNVDAGSIVLTGGDDSGVTINGNALDIDPNAYNHLDDGESEIITYSYDIIDGNGGSVAQTATITITGTNDAPEIDLVSGLTGDVFEIADGAPGENAVVTQISNTITFTDPEISDAHSAVITPIGPNVANYIGIMGGALTDTATGDGVGEISWVFNINDSELDFLAAGEVIIQTYEVSVQDDGAIPLSDTETITITITGTNDAPEITSGDPAVDITENAGLTGDATTHDEGGTITFDDPDISDTDHTLTTSLVATGVTGGLPGAAILDGFLTLSGLTVAMGSGTFDWDFSAADSVFDYLADGEVVTLTYTVTIDDGDGGTVTQDIILTVTGTNDAPTTSIQPGDFNSASLDETDAGLTAGSTISVQDVDISDEVTVVVDSVIESGDLSGIANGTLLAMLGVDMGAIIDAVSTDGTINWSFDSGAEAFDYLADGESLVLTYSLLVEDDAMGSTLQPVTITINGTNDQPVITLGDDTGAVTEDASMPNLTDTGSFAFSDADDSDVLMATVAQEGAATTSGPSGIPAGLTAALAGAMGIVQTGMNDGTIDWTFTLDNALTQYLGEGETVTVVYRVSIDDGSGTANAVQTQDITVTITGTNDVPVATGDVLAINEDDLVMGTVATNDTDADTSAVLTYTLTAPIDGLTMNPDGSYSFDADHPTYAHLAGGVIEVVNAAYIVTDDQGATDTETLVITITGVNDAPTLAGPVLATAFEDDTSFLIDLLSGASDVDDGDSVSIANVTGLTAGVTLMGNLLTIDPTDAAFQSLIEGEELIIVVSYDVEDLNGGVSPQTATITITGTNDDPVVAAALTDGSTEDDAAFSVDMLSGASDVDNMSVINVDAGSVMTVSGDDSGVTLNGNALDVDPSVYNYLGAGESAVIVIGYNITDGVGGIVAQTATITITGVDDLAVVTGDIAGAVMEGDLADVTTFAGNLAIDDPDTSDTPEFNVVAPTAGDNGYGTFEITNTGDWVFTLDQAAVEDLNDGDVVMDTFTFTASDGTTQLVTVTINAANNVFTLTPGADNFTGSAGIDIVDGLDGADIINGGAGDDMLMGGAGNDQLTGGLGADVLDGGTGADRAVYSAASSGVTINAINVALNTGEAAGDTYISIENFYGSGFDDSITGGSDNNDLVGLGGNDVLIGAGGRDRLFGGDGDDRLLGGTGNDDLHGQGGADTYVIRAGAGTDRIFTYEVGIDTIEMRDGAASFAALTILQVGANTEITHVNGVIVLIGIMVGAVMAGDFVFINPLPGPTGVDVTTDLTAAADNFTGDENNDIVNGLGGNDIINGGIGDDTLNGGDGNDQLTGGLGADILDGGAGIDRASYSAASTGVTINAINSAFNTGEAAGDTYISIENFAGSAYIDVITGSNGNNDLFGLDGNDVLIGAGGNDRLFGGNHNDRLLGGTGNDDLHGQGGNDTYVIQANAGNDRIFGFEDGLDIIEFRDGPADFASLTITQVGANVEVASISGTLTLIGFTATDLDASDFTFFTPVPPAEAPSAPKGSAAQESVEGIDKSTAQDDIAQFLIQSPPAPMAEGGLNGSGEFASNDDADASYMGEVFDFI